MKNIDRVVSKDSIFELMDKPTDQHLEFIYLKSKGTRYRYKNIRGIGYKLEKIH